MDSLGELVFMLPLLPEAAHKQPATGNCSGTWFSIDASTVSDYQ